MKRLVLIGLLLFSGLAQAQQTITASYWAGASFAPSALRWNLYTHASIFAAGVGPSGTVVLRDLTQANINAFVSAGHAAGKKVLVTITDQPPAAGTYQDATSSTNIATFVTNVSNFLTSNGFDGVEIDWEGTIVNAQYVDLISRIRKALPSTLITLDMGRGSAFTSVANSAQGNLDRINVMCYDMDGGSTTWYNDALYQGPTYIADTCDISLYAYTNAGVAAGKMVVGIPFYGRQYTGATGPNQAFTGKSTMFYNTLVNDAVRWQNQYKQWDSTHAASYLSIPTLNPTEFITYTSNQQIQTIVSWAQSKGYNGYFAYAPDQEYLSGQVGDAQFPLSLTLYTAVTGGGTAPTITSTSPLPSGTVGVAYSYTLTATGTTPITWSITSGALPAGLSLNGTTGVISGTPTTAGGPTSVTIQAANGVLPNASTVFSITINALPNITTTFLPNGIVGTAYSQTLAATGTTPITWSVVSGSLPAGLSLNSSTGVISGTPTTSSGGAPVNFTVQATNVAGSDTQALGITVDQAPSITTASPLPNGTVGVAYSQTLVATGTTPITWSVAAGSSLPSWMSLNSSTGVLSGTPTVAGTSNFSITATNSAGSNTKAFALTVQSNIVVTVSPAAVSLGQSGTQQFTASLTGTTNQNVTWSPPSQGSISASGLYTAPATIAAQASVTITATSVADPSKTGTATVTLYPPPVITTTTVPSGTVGVMYSQTLVATGGGSQTWSVSSGALPAGLSLSAAGAITGSPTTAGAAANFTVQVTTVGGTATQALSIAVAAATSCSLNRIFVPAI